jgi:hypothetical protein
MSLSWFHLFVIRQCRHTFHCTNFVHVQMHTQETSTAVQKIYGSFIVTDGGNGLQPWSVPANVMSEQPRATDKGQSFILGVCQGANNT